MNGTKYFNKFLKAETKTMSEKLMEKAGKVAEKVVSEFLENKPTTRDWEKVSLIQTEAQHITNVSFLNSLSFTDFQLCV